MERSKDARATEYSRWDGGRPTVTKIETDQWRSSTQRGCDLTFQQSIVRHVKEKRIIRGKRDIEPAFEEIWKWVLIQLPEEEVVRKRRNG